MRFVFPYVPPGSNQLHRMDKFAVARERRQIHKDVALLVGRRSLPPIDPAHITLDFRWASRRKRDVLNYAEGFKAGCDELVKLGWLVDDSADHLAATVQGQLGCGGTDHIIVTLEEVSDD